MFKPDYESPFLICGYDLVDDERYHRCRACAEYCRLLKKHVDGQPKQDDVLKCVGNGRCVECAYASGCVILKRKMPPPRRSWFVDHMLLHDGEKFSLLKVLRRLASLLSR